MRNDLKACDGPQLANAAPIGRGHSRRRRTMRGLLALPLALALIAPGATALAAGTTTGYSQVTPPPQTTSVPATKTEPTSTAKGEVSPSSTSSTPTSSTPASSNSEPTATTATKASAKTLPFTGLDLRWVILGGVLLVGMGTSILIVQRGRSTNR